MRAKLAAFCLLLGCLAAAGPAAAADTKTYTSPDGTLEFDYPVGWSLDGEWPSYVSVLSPIKTQTNGHLADGEAKVEFSAGTDAAGKSLDDLKDEYCEPTPEIEETIYECKITRFNGRSWVWKYSLGHAFGGVWLRLVATIANGKIYSIGALVPDGQSRSAGLAVTKDIALSAFVNEIELATTGLGTAPIGALGLGFLASGLGLRALRAKRAA